MRQYQNQTRVFLLLPISPPFNQQTKSTTTPDPKPNISTKNSNNNQLESKPTEKQQLNSKKLPTYGVESTMKTSNANKDSSRLPPGDGLNLHSHSKPPHLSAPKMPPYYLPRRPPIPSQPMLKAPPPQPNNLNLEQPEPKETLLIQPPLEKPDQISLPQKRLNLPIPSQAMLAVQARSTEMLQSPN